MLGKWVCQTFIYGYIVTKYGCNSLYLLTGYEGNSKSIDPEIPTIARGFMICKADVCLQTIIIYISVFCKQLMVCRYLT